MISALTYDSYSIHISSEGTEKICYFLLPRDFDEDGMKWLEKTGSDAELSGCTLVTVTGMDWNRELTPWEAPRVFRGECDFGGGADLFLATLSGKIIPFVEKFLLDKQKTGMDAALPRIKVNTSRILLGVSLSGLFAIWAAHKTDLFQSVASVSGSLWFDGFTRWLHAEELSPSIKRIYISLGDREENSKNPRIASVRKETTAAVEILRSKLPDTAFEMIPGTHFSPLPPKFERALRVLCF